MTTEIHDATLNLSIVSHTNIGKTTLARTLLNRDIGEIADRAHVTVTADPYPLIDVPSGARLILWDTPGFGNSVNLAKRLEARSNPLGWFLGESGTVLPTSRNGSTKRHFYTSETSPTSFSTSSTPHSCPRPLPTSPRK